MTPDGKKIPSGKDVFTQVGTEEFFTAHALCKSCYPLLHY